MSTGTTPTERFQVVIAGGGVGALEGALALRDLAGDLVDLTLIAPADDMVYRPMTVREPFSYALAERYPIEPIARDLDMRLVRDTVTSVAPDARRVRTEAGSELAYDALLLALGAQIHPRYAHVITIDDKQLDDLLHGLIQDIEGGYVNHLAFVIPARMAWPLPVYELALMSAARAYDANVQLPITVLTPEDEPLAIFGQGASQGVSELLAKAGVEVITSAYCEIAESGEITITPGDRVLRADRIVALPELDGPSLPGLPADPHGFLPVDNHNQVRDVERVFAAGDVTDFAVKQGGIAAQQADTAAQAIAALAGAAIEPQPFHPVVYGMLLTGAAPRYLKAEITGGHGAASEITDQPTWSPPTKIVAKYLAPYLEQRSR
ncbi:MAG: FAD-dependent oxidoreductase [Solirubrobacteraceae bacterium]